MKIGDAMKNKNKKNKYKIIILKNLKWLLVAFLFIFLASISFFLYKQQKETNLKRLEIEKQNQILLEEKEREKVELKNKTRVEDCQKKAKLNYEEELNSLESKKQEVLRDFYSTQQYLEAKQDLEESKEIYTEKVKSVNETLDALCDYSDRAPGESPTAILSRCQDYRENFYTQLAELKITLIDNMENKIEVLKSNYYKSIEDDFKKNLNDLEQSFDKKFVECNEI